ncbi:MAG: DUF732 domain-containing protein [Rhodococcus sp. (in: high G+C Gram-positive bacteria)]|uniref:DUF732 domain-containing protein n=1 Tax=Rhodococcus sp. TaxID=1831 RepID=UPI003D9BE193
MPARTRSRSTRVFGALAAAIAATAVLSACGSDDSTATSTPTTTSVTTSTSTVSPTDEADETGAGETSSTTASGDESAPPAATPAPGGGAPGGAPAPTAEGEEFLAALRAEGVEPSDEAGAISIADYICSAQAQGGSPSEVKTFVTALVGSESVTSGGEITEEQAAATADTYIAVAGDTYCS